MQIPHEAVRSVNGTYADDNTATIESLGLGNFKATTAMSGPARYYRIKY